MRVRNGEWADEPLQIIERVEEYERGNVRRAASGRTTSITTEAADNIKVHRRENRPGLLYDESMEGFDPASWPHVIVPPDSGSGTRRVLLAGDEGEEPTVLDVYYDPDAGALPSLGRLGAAARVMLDEHRNGAW